MTPDEIRTFVRLHEKTIATAPRGADRGQPLRGPDFHLAVEGLVADSDRAALFFRITGTHQGSAH